MSSFELKKLQLGLSLLTEKERNMLKRYIQETDYGRKVVDEAKLSQQQKPNTKPGRYD